MIDYTVILAFEGERPVLYSTFVRADHPRPAIRIAAYEARQAGRDLDLWTDTICIEGRHPDMAPVEYHGSTEPPVYAVEPWTA